MSFEDEIEELESAEDFLQYFQLPYDQTVVHVNRLHILQRFHDYLQKAADGMPEDEVMVLEKEVQHITDQFIVKVDKMLEVKEKDIMTV